MQGKFGYFEHQNRSGIKTMLLLFLREKEYLS